MSYSRSPVKHTGYNSHSVGEVEEAEKVNINWVKHELGIMRPGLSAPITRELMVHHMHLFCTCTLLLFPTMLLMCNFVLMLAPPLGPVVSGTTATCLSRYNWLNSWMPCCHLTCSILNSQMAGFSPLSSPYPFYKATKSPNSAVLFSHCCHVGS